MFLHKLKDVILFGCLLFLTACGMFQNVPVWLSKVDFEVSPRANGGQPFVCHIAVAYSQDLFEKLRGMSDSKAYFEQVGNLQKAYRDTLELFKFDMVPGRNQIGKNIRLRSYSNAKGAFIFAKYTTAGKFMENVGMARTLTVKFLPNKMELHPDISLERLASQLMN